MNAIETGLAFCRLDFSLLAQRDVGILEPHVSPCFDPPIIIRSALAEQAYRARLEAFAGNYDVFHVALEQSLAVCVSTFLANQLARLLLFGNMPSIPLRFAKYLGEFLSIVGVCGIRFRLRPLQAYLGRYRVGHDIPKDIFGGKRTTGKYG
jgi:hypothetical protein